MNQKTGKAIITILIIVLVFLQPMSARGEVKIGDRIYYYVNLNYQEHLSTPPILTQVSWLGNLTVETYTTIVVEITEIDLDEILGIWDYATENTLEDIQHMLNDSNYQPPEETVDITDLIIWTKTPEEVNWNTKATLLNGTTTTDDYTIRATYFESINLYQETHTSGNTSWAYFIDTTTGILDTLSVNGNQTSLMVDNASVNSIEIKQTFPFNYKPKYIYTVVFLLGQVLITIVLIGIVFFISMRYKK